MQRVTIGVVEVEGDPRYEPVMTGRLVLRPREHPFAGAELAIEEARALARVLKVEFALERMRVKSADAVAPAVVEALARDVHHFLIDAPTEASGPCSLPCAAATRSCSTCRWPTTRCGASCALPSSCTHCPARR